MEDRVLNVALVALFLYFLIFWDCTLTFTSYSVKRVIKFQGLGWYLLYRMNHMPEHAYFLSYEKSAKAGQ